MVYSVHTMLSWPIIVTTLLLGRPACVRTALQFEQYVTSLELLSKWCPGNSTWSKYVHDHVQCVTIGSQAGHCQMMEFNHQAHVCSCHEDNVMISEDCQPNNGSVFYERNNEGCPRNYRLHAQSNTCFNVIDGCVSWTLGRIMCQQQGADIAVLSDDAFFDFLLLLLRNYPISSCPNAFHTGVWVGGIKNESTESWMWTSGEPIRTQRWMINQPNGSYNKDCMNLVSMFAYLGNDAPCYHHYKVVCSKAMRHDV